MPIAASLEIAVPEVVLAEVRRKSAQVEFENFRETIVDHFPDTQLIEVRLVEDPDENDRCWVVFQIVFPAELEIGEVLEKRRRFYKDFESRGPHVPWPICTFSFRFA